MAQDLLDRFVGFVRGHTSSDRARPGVGVGFIVAAIAVLLLGLRWFTDEGGTGDSSDQSWALDVSSGSPTTTIGASPEAVAVRVGTAVPRGAEDDSTVSIGIPGTSLEIEIPLGPTTTGPGGTGGSPTTGGSPGGGGGGTTPTTRQTPSTNPTTTTSTRPSTTTSTDPTTTTSTNPTTTTPPTTAPPTTETSLQP
jgi:hypothetical protein